ncbi:MAG: hypothetical protein R3B96_00400 [Pirellulaceae bacterium]
MFEPGIDVTVVPHLYDLKTDGTGMLALQGVKGDLVVCSWLFSRAAFWVLDRSGIRGRMGVTLLVPDEEDEEELEEELDASGTDKDRVSDRRDLPDRTIWTLDLKVKPSVDDYIEEIKRIATLQTTKTYQLAPSRAGSSARRWSDITRESSGPWWPRSRIRPMAPATVRPIAWMPATGNADGIP